MPVVQAASTPNQTSGGPDKLRFVMPPELVNQAATRLCWMSNLFAITTVAMIVLQGYFQPEVRLALNQPLLRLTALFTLFLTLGFAAAHRFNWFSKITLIHLGGVFEAAGAFMCASFETSISHQDEVVRGVSFVALWIVLNGLLIPNPPGLKLTTSIISASMWPLAYWVNLQVYGFEPLPLNRLAVWLLPLITAVLWSHLFNKRLFHMHMASQKAEEMGSYQLDFLIGKGGMGEVWRARHKMLQRDAAIKVIRPEVLANQGGRQAETLRRRFEKEARATASLRSPHTVALFDFGMARDQSFFYVMELLDGLDLQTIVERFGPLPPGRVAQIIRQSCDSLEEAHRQGLVHRDIKPTNLFLCRLGMNYDFTKVLDFGLVKTLTSNSGATLMTMEGQATGTPAYMAPEVALGSDAIDQRADIYGLGCVAYFLLTGQLVFNEPTPTAMSLAHVQKTPTRPSERVETPIPADLEAVILRCLAKDPDQRPRSAQELAEAIEAAAGIQEWSRTDAARWWSLNLPESPSAAGTPTAQMVSDPEGRLVVAGRYT
ncbi:MAG: serine/threonine protein kinase [Bryobacteraceae bacterium]|nr:serine/threonine protein kinase [Bryobacteraceae bacterium]